MRTVEPEVYGFVRRVQKVERDRRTKMDVISLTPEMGLLAGACALILIPLLQQLFTEVSRWGRKKPEDGDLWGG